VPVDYPRPGWQRFSLPVIKLPASSPRQRIGSLVVNPGGPGGSGIQYALQARSQVSPAVRARFDVVGFDPRGVAASIPAVSCLSDQQLDRYFATNDAPANSSQLAAVVSQSKLFARGCQQRSGPLLPYVGTPNAARDMDVLRAVLGDRKLTYLGKSYGTYLGTWYAQLFPGHVRALVLDGAVNPVQSAVTANIVQAKGFEVALRSFAANCVQQSTCPLGRGSVSSAIGRLQGLLDKAARSPLPSQIGGQPGNEPLLLNGVAASLYSKTYWSYLRSGLTAAFSGDATIMVELGDLLVERSPSGHYSNLTAANTAVNCIDRPWPRSLAPMPSGPRAPPNSVRRSCGAACRAPTGRCRPRPSPR
jgi:pimeloyl-ACP methyl ester carboxylesterase